MIEVKHNKFNLKNADIKHLKKELAKLGYVALSENDFIALSEGIASRICNGLRQILGANYPPCLEQLTKVIIWSTQSYYNFKLKYLLGKNVTWGANCCITNIKLKKAKIVNHPNKTIWIITDKQRKQANPLHFKN